MHPIAYAAYTDHGTFMLDDKGICRWAVATVGPLPERILGSQYVASLDLESKQGLIALPKVGVPMLFAAIDPDGRVSLVKTSPVLRFEDKRDEASLTSSPTPPSSGRRAPVIQRTRYPSHSDVVVKGTERPRIPVCADSSAPLPLVYRTHR